MKLSDYIEKYGDCEVAEEIEKCIIKKPKTVWDLKEGDKYFFISCDGDVGQTTYRAVSFERDCITQGNAFLTSEEAKFESDKRKVIAELKRYAYDFCEEEWRDMDIDKYYMFYDYEFDSFNVSYRQTFKYLNEINFKSEEDADKAIKDVGEDRIKKYLFGIES